jgi:ABC-type sulfate/molybdate transport systems ATPase subunit
VTHDSAEARQLADQVIVLDEGQIVRQLPRL